MVGLYFNCRPNKIVRIYFKVSAILSNYFSITIYRFCGHVSLRLWKAVGLPYWIITVTNCNSLASV